MRTFARLGLIVVFLCHSSAALTLEPALTGIPNAPLHAEPSQLRAGEDVTVAGFGCAPLNEVRFDLFSPEHSSSAATLARDDGTFVESIRLPSSANVGSARLQASCLTGDAQPRVMEAVIVIERPAFAVTGVNLAFGIGTMLIVFGVGILLLKSPGKRRAYND